MLPHLLSTSLFYPYLGYGPTKSPPLHDGKGFSYRRKKCHVALSSPLFKPEKGPKGGRTSHALNGKYYM